MTETLTRAADAAFDPPWTDEVTDDLMCVDIVDVTHDVKSFVLRPARPQRLRFQPGQYLTLRVQVDGRVLERCYTVASPPTRPETLSITVKRVPDGPVSNHLHDSLRIGDRVRASGPLGRFSMDNHPAGKYLFLSAGSGITPLISMARTLQDRGTQADLVFVHNARTPADIIFREELDVLAAMEHVTVVAICETDAPNERWHGVRGRLSAAILEWIAPDVADREVFTCGPPAYMTAVRELLGAAGADTRRCHEESFALEPAPAGPSSNPGSASSTTYSVEFRHSGRVVECGADSTILDAALRAGVAVPSSCGEGMCGTCKTMMLGGEVDMQHAGGIRPREIAANKILPCCSRPRTDIVLDA